MGSGPTLKIPVFVALDVDSDVEALKLAEKVNDYVGGFKVGPRLTYKYGAEFVKSLSQFGPVFVDNKYHDIPTTVLAAVRAAFLSGASFVTVHASNGFETLKKLTLLEAELKRERSFQILSVTVLTSFSEKTVPTNWRAQAVIEHVEALAGESFSAGLNGVVCSPHELINLRKKFPKSFLITPGIRMPTNSKDDQSRVMSPAQALRSGASALVIGRPIIEASDPVHAAKSIAMSLIPD